MITYLMMISSSTAENSQEAHRKANRARRKQAARNPTAGRTTPEQSCPDGPSGNTRRRRSYPTLGETKQRADIRRRTHGHRIDPRYVGNPHAAANSSM
eukprot:IDg13970t1